MVRYTGKFRPKPTLYKGVQMRSRLEAKWAAFFDQCGWEWEYEPFDRDGWIPDFLLRGERHDTMVEVKPLSVSRRRGWDATIRKVTKCVHRGYSAEDLDFMRRDNGMPEVLFLGDGISGKGSLPRRLGFLIDRTWTISPARFCADGKTGLPDFYSDHSALELRMSGVVWEEGLSLEGMVSHLDPLPAWRKASNVVQWKAQSGG